MWGPGGAWDLVVEADIGDEVGNEGVDGGEAIPHVVPGVHDGVARLVELLRLLVQVGGGHDDEGGKPALSVFEAVVGLVPVEDEIALPDRSVVGVVILCGSVTDFDYCDRDLEPEGELHGDCVVVLEQDRQAECGVRSARRREPHSVIVIALHTRVVGVCSVDICLSVLRASRPHLRAGHYHIRRKQLKHSCPRIKEAMWPVSKIVTSIKVQ